MMMLMAMQRAKMAVIVMMVMRMMMDYFSFCLSFVLMALVILMMFVSQLV